MVTERSSSPAPASARSEAAGDERGGSGHETSVAAEAFFEHSASKDATGLPTAVTGYQTGRPRWRSPFLLVVLIGVSAWLLFGMRADISYFLQEPVPRNLGDMDGYELGGLAPNMYVEIEGLPHHLQAQYKQLGRRYKVYPLIGTRVFVRESLKDKDGFADDYPSFFAAGRLLDIREERAYDNIRGFFRDRGRFDFSEPAWIILSDVRPRESWWVPVSAMLLVAILLLNLGLLIRRYLYHAKR